MELLGSHSAYGFSTMISMAMVAATKKTAGVPPGYFVLKQEILTAEANTKWPHRRPPSEG
jgi:hypothetical protein